MSVKMSINRTFRLLLSAACAAVMLGSALPAGAAAPEIRTRIERGRELFGAGRWSDARHEFRAVRRDLAAADLRERETVEFYLAACAVELGDPDAEAMLVAFEQEYPESAFANDVRFSLASYYCTTGDLHQAREEFLRVDYDRLTARRREQYDIRMGTATFAEGDYAAAYDYFVRIPPRSEYADHARYHTSYIDYAAGRYGRAKQGFEQLLKSDAYGALMPYYLLQIEYLEGNYRYVVEHGETLAAKAVPAHRAEIERLMAESWFHLDDYGRTLQHLDAFQAAEGQNDRETAYLRGFSLYRTARYAEAAEWLRQACGAEDALTQNASYHLADCYVRAGEKQAAMQAFAMAADERFDREIAEDALFNYAKLQYELGGGAFNGAINQLSRYLTLYPSSPRAAEARTLLVAAYYNSRDYDAAYRAIRTLPDPDADVRTALQKITYFRALEAYNAGDLAAAERYLAESAAVDISPRYTALASFWQGEIAYARKDYTVAAAKYNAFLSRAPRGGDETAMAWYGLGYCNFEQQHLPQAAQAFDRFLSARPAKDRYRADVYNRLGDIRYADRRFDAAVGEYERAISLGGSEAHYARYKRALTLGVMGRNDQKRKALQQIIADNRGDYVADAAYELGRSFIAEGDYARGAEALEGFVVQFPSSPRVMQAYSDMGLAYLNLGDRQRSLACYDKVVASAPRSQEAREAMQGIRDIYVSEGNVDAYFDYAERSGMESDLAALSRDSLSFASAQQLYIAGQDEAAARALRSYVNSYPKGSYTTDARYYLSDVCLRTGARDEAIETLTALSDEAANPHTVTVLEKLSELTWADGRYDEAAAAYRKLYDAAPTAAGRESAMTGYVRATVAGGDAAKIEAMAADVASHAADAGPTALREAKFARAEQLRTSGQTARATELYRELAAEVRTAEGSAAGYYVIESLFGAGDLNGAEQAVYAYSGREPRAYWLAKAFLLLGDIYLRRGDTFQARATYQSVADGYSPADDGIVAEAKARIQKLN